MFDVYFYVRISLRAHTCLMESHAFYRIEDSYSFFLDHWVGGLELMTLLC